MKRQPMKKLSIEMTSWQRLEQVIKWAGMSTNRFANAVGLKRSENLYQIKRGAFGVSKELSSLITKKYPQINRGWLLTGDGQMMAGVAAAGIDPDNVIPFFNIDATQLATLDLEKQKPLYNISFPVAADFAAQCIGNSMVPDIPNGSTVIFKRVEVDTFLPGSPYLVITKDFATIKVVRTVTGEPTKLLLQPRNTADFDEVIVEKSKVRKIYAVKVVITTFS